MWNRQHIIFIWRWPCWHIFKSTLLQLYEINFKSQILSDLNMSCVILFHVIWLLTFAVRLKSTTYKSHWNILVLHEQWKITSDLNMSHGKISDFVSFPLFRFTLVIKLWNSNFESHWNTLIYFDKKRSAAKFKMSHGKMSDSF